MCVSLLTSRKVARSCSKKGSVLFACQSCEWLSRVNSSKSAWSWTFGLPVVALTLQIVAMSFAHFGFGSVSCRAKRN